MNCMWKWKRSSVVEINLENLNSSHKFVYLIIYSSSCCIGVERKEDLSHLMIKTYFFLQILQYFRSFVARHRRHPPFPRLRVEGHRHLRQRANSRFIRFRTSV